MSGSPDVFIPLTDARNKKTILINMKNVKSVSESRGITRLFIKEDSEDEMKEKFYKVKETPLDILVIYQKYAYPLAHTA